MPERTRLPARSTADEPLVLITSDRTSQDVWVRISGSRYAHAALSVTQTLDELLELRDDGVTVTPVAVPASIDGRLTITVDGVADDAWPTALLLDDHEHALVGRGVDDGELSREAILGGLELLLAHLQPTDAQRRAVARGVTEPDPKRVDRAAHLLAALEAAGQALEVDPEAWRAVTSLSLAPGTSRDGRQGDDARPRPACRRRGRSRWLGSLRRVARGAAARRA